MKKTNFVSLFTMKKRILTISAIMASASLLVFTTSCDKLKDKLFQAFSAQGGSVDFTIPIITDTNTKQDMGTATYNLNIDSIIKAETGGAFSLNSIDEINVEECKLKINNADADNNFQNFEQGWVNLSTNTSPTPLNIATGPIADTYAEEFLLPTVAGADVKPYLQGNVLTYVYQAKMRKATTKPLEVTLSVKLRIK
jgi:hypothetical protein